MKPRATSSERRRSPCVVAMFERQPAAGPQVSGGAINKSGQGRESIASGSQRRPRLVAQAVSMSTGSSPATYGGLLTSASKRRPASAAYQSPCSPFDASARQALAVAARHGKRRLGGVGAEHAPARTFVRERDGDGARTGAEVRHVPLLARSRDRARAALTARSRAAARARRRFTVKSSDQNSRRPRR